MATLYMIPNTLGVTPVGGVIPLEVQEIIRSVKVFIVEDIRTTRRFLKRVDKAIDIDTLTFYVLDKRTKSREIEEMIQPLAKGENVGVISEAGCPGVADPGASVVQLAHKKGYRVVPLVGPSSILLAMMASGMNGQSFAFNGYLPMKKPDRVKKILHLEKRSFQEQQSQVFIETPFRNDTMFDDILSTCASNTHICVACDITLESEYIKTATVAEWKKNKPSLHKRPAIFIIHKF
ncbi:SAM-dependent methyltransferase [Halosquirtibacter xylanolyticus]|uniref:SAM-dependent methyltransferase n=1 Tax=Halosquirtibacter xylanolyticus TaxID=3374599 RepID=UPI003747BEB0|nr:SAM-dependent methyltransferase [Prolixibacteraceae bacterium]